MIKGFEDAFTDLQSEFVSLCMEYTNGSVDKIYIYILKAIFQLYKIYFFRSNVKQGDSI